MVHKPSSLDVSLIRELTEYVGDRVRSGRYRSASEVVRTAQREEPGSTGAEPKEARRVPAAPDAHG